MAKVAKAAGVPRESLYRALSADGNPRFSTLQAVLKAAVSSSPSSQVWLGRDSRVEHNQQPGAVERATSAALMPSNARP
jgi:addiction module antidote-like protein